MLSTVHIEGLEFYAYTGASDAEQEVGHRFILDLALEVDQNASVTDKVSDTVDYALVIQQALLATEKKYRTVERLANQIGEQILGKFTRVEAVECFLRKVAPPAPCIVAEVGIHLRKERG